MNAFAYGCCSFVKLLPVVNENVFLIATLVKEAISSNASTAQSQEAYNKHFSELTKKYEIAVEKLKTVDEEIASKQHRSAELKLFINNLKSASSEILEFDEKIWNIFVESVTVESDGKLRFKFRNNQEITI